MADNTLLNAGTGGDTLSTDELSAGPPKIVVQRVKVQYGIDGSATDVSDSNPLPIDDAGGSLTVDGSVSVTGTPTVDLTKINGTTVKEGIGVSTGGGCLRVAITSDQLATGSSLADSMATPTATRIGSSGMVWRPDAGNWWRERAYCEDQPNEVTNQGPYVLGRRRDADTAVVVDGDYHGLMFDNAGALKVNVKAGSVSLSGIGGIATEVTLAALNAKVTACNTGAVTIANAGLGSAVNVQDGGNSLTVDGTVAVTQSTSPWVVSGTVDTELTTDDLDTGGGTDTRAVVGLVGAASGGGQLIPGNATSGLKVDLGADNDVTVTGTVTANLAAGTNNIGDVDVLTLPSLPAGSNNIGDVDVLTLPSLPAGTNNIGDVDVVTLPALPAGTNNIGDVDILTVPAPLNVIGNGAHGTALRVTLANDSTGTVAATCIQATASNLNAQVVGNIAHSSGASGNPVAMSAIAQDMDDTGPPNQVDAENDVVRIAADRDGGVFVHTHGPRIWSYAAEHTTTQTNTSIKTGPASGLSFYITDIYVVANGAVTITIEDTTAVLLWRYYAAAAGDGAVCNFTTPIKVVATRGIQLDTSAAVTVFISVNGYTAAG